jgi:hypothetical protein
MQYINLTDDELWRAIAEKTNAMSRLLYQQLEFGAYIGSSRTTKQADCPFDHWFGL